MTWRTIAAALIFAFAFPAAAQNTDEGQERTKEEKVFRKLIEDEVSAQSREQAENRDTIELVETLMMVRMSRALGLTDDETVVMIRRIGTYKDQVYALKWKRGRTLDELRQGVSGNASEEFIASRLDMLLDQDESIVSLTRTMIEEAQKDLTIEQTAKLYLFIGDFEQEMHQLILRAKELSSRYKAGDTPPSENVSTEGSRLDPSEVPQHINPQDR